MARGIKGGLPGIKLPAAGEVIPPQGVAGLEREGPGDVGVKTHMVLMEGRLQFPAGDPEQEVGLRIGELSGLPVAEVDGRLAGRFGHTLLDAPGDGDLIASRMQHFRFQMAEAPARHGIGLFAEDHGLFFAIHNDLVPDARGDGGRVAVSGSRRRATPDQHEHSSEGEDPWGAAHGGVRVWVEEVVGMMGRISLALLNPRPPLLQRVFE